jgi:isoleucyl-tRNA synthetase
MASSKSQFSQIEEAMLQTWEQEKTFAKSLQQRPKSKYFSFYDGPPFANGLPHYGHVVPGAIKDAVARYKTMQGYHVPRKAGWDTHGLPVEYDVEKQLKISGKKQILAMGVDKFNQACRDSVFRYKEDFERFILRMGRWLDLDNPYATLDDDYIESVWWVVSQLHQKELLYQGYRSMPYCPRCATPLSNFELNQGYQDDVKDPSVYALFPLVEDPEVALVAWTTTPWTLPANAALAVDEKADYVTAKVKGQKYHLIVAKKLLEQVLADDEYEVIKTQKGKDLVGQKYESLYELPPEYKVIASNKEAPSKVGEVKNAVKSASANVHKVYASSGISLEDGTGVLHVAPRYGELDLELGQRYDLPLIESVDGNGMVTKVFEPAMGKFFKDADADIIADLTTKGKLFAVDDSFTHTYPFCWRCDTPLLYYATPTWNVAVTKIRDQLVKNNQSINWVPPHIKSGRFGNWVAEARDWGISRNRFWGAPLPIWICSSNSSHRLIVVDSIAKLKKIAANPDAVHDLHRPHIDKVRVRCDECGMEAQRVEEVLDCWFESGSMPYGQQHYPFENKAEFERGFPAEFISEGLDQTRGWFYTLHVLATALENKPAFKNVVCHGIVVAADGKKLSKRLRNYPPLEDVFDNYGADVLRFFMLSSPVVNGEEVRFGADHLKDTQRNVFMTWWNTFSFFKMYTDIDGWQPQKSLRQPKTQNVLDNWILSRLNEVIAEVTKQADKYQLSRATRPIAELIADLSNWYVRRSRRRFWKSEDDKDKQAAYVTLHYTLLRLSQLMAPWAPFLSDHIYRQLRTSDMPESVHLSDWPLAAKVDTLLLEEMKKIRGYIAEGLAQRADAGVKVRQPLASVELPKLSQEFEPIVLEELNVKQITVGSEVRVDAKLSDELKREGLMREIVRHVQQYRKELGLKVDDRIRLSLVTADHQLQVTLAEHAEVIKAETLALDLSTESKADQLKPVDVEGAKLEIGIAKAS